MAGIDGIKPDIGLLRGNESDQRQAALLNGAAAALGAGARGPGGAAQAAPVDPERAGEAATQFEALLLQQMFSAMWQNVPQDSLLGSDQADEYYRDMLNETLSNQIAKDQSIGISAQIMKEFKKTGAAGEKPEEG